MGYIIKRTLPTGVWFLKKNGAWSDSEDEAKKYRIQTEANDILAYMPRIWEAMICKV